MMIVLNLDAPCGKYSLGYCRWYCDWTTCKHVTDATRYLWARIAEGIEQPLDTRVL